MLRAPRQSVSAIPVGLASVVLGTIGLALFFLPVLGVPIALCGLLAGVAGIVVAASGGGASLRWSMAGLAVSCVAIGAGLIIMSAPRGEEPSRSARRLWETQSDRPYVPPPARPTAS
jgi:hypothetical protein